MALQFASCFACVDVGTHAIGTATGGEFRDHISPAANCILSADTVTKRFGAASLKVSRADGDATADYLLQPFLVAAQTEGAIGFWVYVPTDGDFPSDNGTDAVMFGFDTGGWCTIGFDKKLRIKDAASVTKAQTTATLSSATWYWVVLRIVYVSGVNNSSFWLRLYDDAGNLIEEIGETAGTGASPWAVTMGPQVGVGATVYFTYHLDGGYAVAGGWPPICPAFVDGMVPTGVGNYAQWGISPDTGEDPYEDVDDVPDDADGTYLTIAVSNQRHSFAHAASGIPGGENVLAVGLKAMCKDGTNNYGLTFASMRLDGTDLEGTLYELGDDYSAAKSELVTATKPGGGAWTIANVDAVEIGVRSYVFFSNECRCTSLVLFAAYGDPPPSEADTLKISGKTWATDVKVVSGVAEASIKKVSGVTAN